MCDCKTTMFKKNFYVIAQHTVFKIMGMKFSFMAWIVLTGTAELGGCILQYVPQAQCIRSTACGHEVGCGART